jgi:hypothetical protein
MEAEAAAGVIWPDDIVCEVLEHLDFRSLLACGQVCHQWKTLAETEFFQRGKKDEKRSNFDSGMPPFPPPSLFLLPLPSLPPCHLDRCFIIAPPPLLHAFFHSLENEMCVVSADCSRSAAALVVCMRWLGGGGVKR